MNADDSVIFHMLFEMDPLMPALLARMLAPTCWRPSYWFFVGHELGCKSARCRPTADGFYFVEGCSSLLRWKLYVPTLSLLRDTFAGDLPRARSLQP
jgi:hypothetical protein